MLMLTLSILHSIKAMKHKPMMVHRLFHLLTVDVTCSRSINEQQGADLTE